MARNVKVSDWWTQVMRTGGVSVGAGYGYLDVAYWSQQARFYGFFRLSGLVTGASWGAVQARGASWWRMSPQQSFSVNDLHSAGGEASLAFAMAGGIDQTISGWRRERYLFAKHRSTDSAGSLSMGVGSCTISGQWILKEEWGFED